MKDSPITTPPYNGPVPGKSFALVGLILSICGIVFSFFCLIPVFGLIVDIVGLICGITGLVLAAMGGNKNAQVGAPRGGISTAGLVCGIIAIVLCSIFVFCSIPMTCAYCAAQDFLTSSRYLY